MALINTAVNTNAIPNPLAQLATILQQRSQNPNNAQQEPAQAIANSQIPSLPAVPQASTAPNPISTYLNGLMTNQVLPAIGGGQPQPAGTQNTSNFQGILNALNGTPLNVNGQQQLTQQPSALNAIYSLFNGDD